MLRWLLALLLLASPAQAAYLGPYLVHTLTPNPASWDPADAPQDTAAADQTVTVTAGGTIAFTSVALVTGGNYFTDLGTGTCTGSTVLTNGQSCTVNLRFAYTAAGGPYADTLRFVHNGPASPLNVALGPVTVSGPPDTTPPTVTSATIGTNGTTLTLAMSETVTRSGGTLDVDCPSAQNIAATYSSGSGSSSLVYTLAQAVLQSDGTSCNLDYDGAANGIEDAAGNDLAAITNGVVTNNSTQTSGLLISEAFNNLTNWTQESGTWALDAGTLNPSAGDNARLIHNTSVGLNQWACVQYLSQGTYGATTFVKMRLRWTSGGTNYAVGRYGTTEIRWMAYNAGSWVANGSPNWTKTLADGEYLCAEVSGTAASPTMQAWVFASTPPVRASWGAAQHTWSTKPGTTSYAGEQVGLFSGGTVQLGLRLDNFSAGTFP